MDQGRVGTWADKREERNFMIFMCEKHGKNGS